MGVRVFRRPTAGDGVSGWDPGAIGAEFHAREEEEDWHTGSAGARASIYRSARTFASPAPAAGSIGPATSGESDWGACRYDGVGPGSRLSDSVHEHARPARAGESRATEDEIGSSTSLPAHRRPRPRPAPGHGRLEDQGPDRSSCVLDALILAASYSLAELVYSRAPGAGPLRRPVRGLPARRSGLQLTANHLFGLYGRMWRHAGIEEARQIVLSSGATLVALLALYPIGRATHVVDVSPRRRRRRSRLLRYGHGGPALPLPALRLAAGIAAPGPAGGRDRQP